MPRKPSFFERLTGTIRLDDYDPEFDEQTSETEEESYSPEVVSEEESSERFDDLPEEAYSADGELGIDVYQTPEEVIVKTMCAGVRPEDLDISITREQVSISGERTEDTSVDSGDYFARELYWGSFSRTINLPVEVEAEEAEAIEKHGLLIIRLPKIQKDKQTKLKVKSA